MESRQDRGSTRAPLLPTVLLPLLPAALLANAAALALDPSPFVAWPAPALAALLALTCPRTLRAPVLGGTVVLATVTCGLLASSPPTVVGLLLALLLPTTIALGAADLLGPGPDLSIGTVGRVRWDGVILSLGVVSGLGAGAVALPGDGLAAAGHAALVTFLGTASALMVTLPLLFPPGSPHALGERAERIAIRAILATNAVLLVVTHGAAAVALGQLATLAWAATRLTRREACLHLAALALLLESVVLLGGTHLDPLVVHAYLAACGWVLVPLAQVVETLRRLAARERRTADTTRRLFTCETSTMIVVLDDAGLVTHFNSGAQAITGWRADEVVGRAPDMLRPPEAVASMARAMGRTPDFATVATELAASGTTQEWTCLTRDGSEAVLALTAHALLDPETGDQAGVFAVGDDVTARARTTAALAAALDREREATDVKHVLVSNLSHELRTPITKVRGFAELLADGDLGPVVPAQQEALRTIMGSADRLTALTVDLLTLSQLEASPLSLERTPLDLAEVAVAGLEHATGLATRRGLRTSCETTGGEVVVHGDRAALERVLANLVENAVKFTPDGGEVVVRTRAEGHRAVLEVRDTGVGIAEDDMPLLFTRFHRGRDATAAETPGTGLGLSIVHALVTAHGGEVQVASRPGSGTTVTVRLPLHVPADPGGARGPGLSRRGS